MLKRGESLTKIYILATCDKCLKQKCARWKCVTCKQAFCENCKKGHVRKSIFKSHSFVNLFGSKDGTAEAVVDILCSCEVKGKISLYCTICGELVCLDCITSNHNGHTFEKLETVNEQQRNKIQSITSEIEGIQIPAVNDLHERIQTWKSEHTITTKHLKDDVLRRNGEIKEQIDGWTKSLLMELDEFSKTEQRKVFDFQPRILKRNKRLIQERERLRLLAQSNDTHLLLQGVNASVRDWEPFDYPELNDIQYLPGPDILSNFPSPLGSFMFTPRGTENGSISNSVSSGDQSLDKTVDHAFNFLVDEDESHGNSNGFSVDLSRITSLSIVSPDIIWIGDIRMKRLELLRITNDKSIHKLTQVNVNFLDFYIQKESECLWVSCVEDKSLSVFTRRGKRRAVNCFQSLLPTCVCITAADTVLLGLSEKRNLWVDKNSVRKIVEIEPPNTVLLEIERDQNGKLLFTFPLRCSVNTRTGGIIAIDSTGQTNGRLIMCDPRGHLKHIYTGETFHNFRKPFDPTGVTSVSTGNVVACDHSNETFHVLDSDGILLKVYRAVELDVEVPYSVACDGNGNFIVGNWPKTEEQGAKVFLLEESVFSASEICI
ncbi:uncharacterized protein LOC127724304 [Mytilus californianus]|uniref:uncharacterized protein LOC127724304 n=1 Tax=Mytilus californianus TaxID=6549 RepID=UPI00224728EA|nr:uncharacterized protein LOC127724304 [Mytilus californianus]